MLNKNKTGIRKLVLTGFFLLTFFATHFVFASVTDGAIDSTYKYAWGENLGWINFGCDNCNVQVTDTGLTGYAWSEQYGWINLNPSTAGVKNDGTGTLSGSAWGANTGWIDFSGVTIDNSGIFSGYATVKHDSSRINFNCADGVNSCGSSDFKVATDYRPNRVSSSGGGSGGGGGGKGGYVPPPTIPPPIVPPVTPPVIPPATNPIVSIINQITNLFNPPPVAIVPVVIPKIPPLALNTEWDLLPVQAINAFVFAPLPSQIQTLAQKFPALGDTFKSVGVQRFTDISKLTGVTLQIPGLAEVLNNTINNLGVQNLSNINNLNGVSLNLPGLSNINNLPNGVNVGTGNLALVPGLPVADFSVAQKKNLPTEFVFARADNELVDLNVALSLNTEGQIDQKIESLPGNILKLVVKPIGPAKSVTGYIAYESAAPKVSDVTNPISLSSLTASALFSMNDIAQNVPTTTQVPVEQKLILSSFEYTDPTHSGIYTADVTAPSAPGSYQIITLIAYVDPTLGTREIAMTTVIDPEGYVYEQDGDKQTRIPSAIVSLYYLNTATKQYELWPASNYQQQNPQITDISGTYSFLVPAGSYYFDVEAPGYAPYNGKVFVATEGGGIHENIEMNSSTGWFTDINWENILLIVVLLLLVYNLSRDKLSKIFKRT